MIGTIHRITATLLAVLLVALAWEFIAWTELADHEYLPPLHEVLVTLTHSLASGKLVTAWLETMQRALGGLIASTILAVFVALLTARYEVCRQAFDPLADILRSLSPAAIVPMSIFFLGLGWKLYGFIVVFACFWPIYMNASNALASVPRLLSASGRSLGYGPWSLLAMVQLPSALPGVFIGIRIAGAVCLIATIVTEMLTGRNGLGFFLVDAGFSLRTPEMFACLIVIMFTGILMNQIVVAARWLVCGWHVRQSQLGLEGH